MRQKHRDTTPSFSPHSFLVLLGSSASTTHLIVHQGLTCLFEAALQSCRRGVPTMHSSYSSHHVNATLPIPKQHVHERGVCDQAAQLLAAQQQLAHVSAEHAEVPHNLWLALPNSCWHA